MKKTIVILSLALLLSCSKSKNESGDKPAEVTEGVTVPSSEATSNYKKYDIKSGIITFDTKMEMSGMKMDSRKVLYFDDYGIKESEEEYKTDPATGKEALSSRNFVKEGFRYSCSLENMNGAKTKAAGYGVAAIFDMNEASALKDNQFKKLDNEMICGKSCEGFSMVTASGNIKMFGWNRINVKTILDNASMEMTSESVATKIEENVSIPADKFEVPEGVVMTDM